MKRSCRTLSIVLASLIAGLVNASTVHAEPERLTFSGTTDTVSYTLDPAANLLILDTGDWYCRNISTTSSPASSTVSLSRAVTQRLDSLEALATGSTASLQANAARTIEDAWSIFSLAGSNPDIGAAVFNVMEVVGCAQGNENVCRRVKSEPQLLAVPTQWFEEGAEALQTVAIDCYTESEMSQVLDHIGSRLQTMRDAVRGDSQ